MMSKAISKERLTSIQVTSSVKQELEELKEHGDTYNHVIKKLLKCANEYKYPLVVSLEKDIYNLINQAEEYNKHEKPIDKELVKRMENTISTLSNIQKGTIMTFAASWTIQKFTEGIPIENQDTNE